jgi:hypothetical protein
MKLLRVLLIIAIILGLAYAAIMIFLPSESTVTRSREMAVPKEFAFDEVNTMKNWMGWMPWAQLDTNMKVTYHGPESGAGAAYSWTSENDQVGNGKLTIVESEPYTSIKTKLEFEGMDPSNGSWKFEEISSEKTTVSWSMHSEAGANPIGRIFLTQMEKFIGPDFEKGLKQLEEKASIAWEAHKAEEAMKAAEMEDMSEEEEVLN